MNNEVVIKSKYMNAKVSMSKAIDIARFVRGMRVADALNFLHYNKRKASDIIFETLKSAIANASHNYKVESKDLFVQDVLLGPGHTRKWRRFAAKGRTNQLLRRTSNVTVILGVSSPKLEKKEATNE
ncbi:50S ribosomal protein L22 [candidate division WWE3 bacterium CG_4_9_14_3_um_filter_34_6]|uniref:50S ribosomal protein L22 n=1 Tax=candidate division WWE3 bacterium CG_4_9_14_3_um_filter_34_6 TaxID=1975079 RepID=A0A2M7X3S5_UNCKA|nr:MAG: 50S ribosomal protein L22 [candidate division WWE3 bacterium CG_4_9_14_3_um_filter_34_6]